MKFKKGDIIIFNGRKIDFDTEFVVLEANYFYSVKPVGGRGGNVIFTHTRHWLEENFDIKKTHPNTNIFK